VTDDHQTGFSPPLPTRMAQLAAEGATGTLAVDSDDARREIFFVHGEIRAARSNVEGEMLGMWLVGREVISEDERALTLLAQGTDELSNLGKLLVSRGCLSQADLERQLQELTLEIIRRAASDPHPGFGFTDGKGDPQPDTLPDVTTSQIILIAARKCSDQVAMWDLLGSFDRKVRLKLSLESVLGQLELTPSEGFILSRLDAARDLSSLKKLSTMPEKEVVASLYALVVAGVVAIDDGSIDTVAVAPQPVMAPIDEPTGVQIESAIDDSEFDERHREERRNIIRLGQEVTRIDHYRALGLQQSAGTDQIEKAFGAIRKRYSPKRIDEPHLVDQRANLTAIVDRAREAYELLSDPKARRRYDSVLESVKREQSLAAGPKRPRTDPTARKTMVEANIRRADQLILMGETYLAIQLLEQACSLDPRPEELLKLARLQMRNPLWIGRALDRLRMAVEINPTFVDGWLEIANFWKARGHTERQRKALERAVGADPWNETACEMYKKLVGSRELDRLLRRVR
jgi:tetratricopeptide (TPR) repeat protein